MEASRQTTVLFADVTGSTKLYEAAGDALAAEAIGRCLEKLRVSAEATGGRVVKTMGDSVMALFSSPDAAASAAARMQVAIEALPQVGDIKLGLRIGFHAGPVIQRDDDFYGDTVNVAYRLHEQAKRGQVLTSDDTASLLPQLLRNSTRLLYSVPVKGKAEDVALCELVWRQSPDITDLATTLSVLRIPLGRLRLKYLGRDIARRRGSDSLLIGRDAGCDLVVADTKASRQHCTIERRQDRFLLRDHSTNGTFVTVVDEVEVMLQREEFPLRKHGWIAFGQPRAGTSDIVEYFCEA
ncbi:MAG TPA: adenylate/guanylate cyclase domain-containing protein [Burkholderiales bacterium]|nr:adenylate/guanylate cyclase domain-containing protein [Burkholderiales bacterium]